MASILVERLMGWGDVEKISVHEFFAAQVEVVQGYLTKAQVKNYYNMDIDTAAEYDTLAAKAPSTDAGKGLYVDRVHAVFILAELKVPGYETPANVRNKLGI